MTDTLIPLFVYGTLRQPAIQRALVGRTLKGDVDILPGYYRDDAGMYPVALPRESAQIEGEILHFTPEELDKIDIYEGDGYRRVQVTLASGKQAWVYIGKQDTR